MEFHLLTPIETCQDGIQNQGEQNVDCGGPCDACGNFDLTFLFRQLDILQFILFADDTTVYFSDVYNEHTEELLVSELKKVSKWLSANKLSLNVDKSNFLHFHYGKKIKPTIRISINDVEVKGKCSVKYLGTMIDNKLSWKAHIEYIRTKLSKSIGVISKVKYFITEKVLTNL